MSIERVTNFGHDRKMRQLANQRYVNSAEHVSFIVQWWLPNTHGRNTPSLSQRESKPTNSYEEALTDYQRHCEHAALVELLEYGEEVTCLQRFCNLTLLKQVRKKTDWVQLVKNPPYEIMEEEEV